MTVEDDEIARQAKLFVDTGLDTPEEAIERLKKLKIMITLGADAAGSSAGQAAFLTAVATAVRCFIGGVHIRGAIDAKPVTPLALGGATVRDVAIAFGAIAISKGGDEPEILIGSVIAAANVSNSSDLVGMASRVLSR